MKLISAFVLGFLAAASIVWAGTYALSVTVNATTDDLFPKFVQYYNSRYGTSYTTVQYAQIICAAELDRKALQAKRFLER